MQFLGSYYSNNSHKYTPWGTSFQDINAVIENLRGEASLQHRVGLLLTGGLVGVIIVVCALAPAAIAALPLLDLVLGAAFFGGMSLLPTAWFYMGYRTNRVAKELFTQLNGDERLKDWRCHFLNAKELKGCISILESYGHEHTCKSLFERLNPIQIIQVMNDPEVGKFGEYLKCNEVYKDIVLNNKSHDDTVKNDRKYRALYLYMAAKRNEVIDEDVFASDFPHVRQALQCKSSNLLDRTFTVIDTSKSINPGNKHLLKLVDPQKVTENEEGCTLNVSNISDLTKVIDVLDRKVGIITREDFENAVKIAEELEMTDLIQDLKIMLKEREDFFENSEALQNFIANHPSLQGR